MPVDNVFGITIKDGTAVIDSGPGVLRRNSATDKSCKFPVGCMCPDTRRN